MSDSKYITKSEFYSTIGSVFLFIGLYYIIPKYGEFGDDLLGTTRSTLFFLMPMAVSIYTFARGREERGKNENI